GKQRSDSFLQYVLSAPIPDLQGRRKRRGEFDDGVVEQWNARFDRMRHAHSVDLRENVLRQIRFEVEAHHPAVWRQRREAREPGSECAFGIPTAQPATDVWRVKSRLFVRLKESHRIQIPAVIASRHMPQEILAPGSV